MHDPHVTTPYGPRKPPVLLLLLAAAAVAGVAFLSVSQRPKKAERHIDAVPAIAMPPVPMPPPTVEHLTLKLELDLPELDAEQRYWLWKARTIAENPRKAAVDQEPIAAFKDDTVRTVWLALLWTESKYRGFAVNAESGACGPGQLLSAHLANAITCGIPEQNLYASAFEFARLLRDNGGNVTAALLAYKGSTDDSTRWQADAVWSVIRVGAK